MSAAAHVSIPVRPAPTSAGPHRPFRISSGLVALGVVAGAMALTLYTDLPWNAAPTTQPPIPLPPLSAAAGVPAFANVVDWSRIEASPDPGPMAIAAYGP